jgi:hypothetical protein
MTPQTSAAGSFGIGAVSSVLSGVGSYQSGQEQKAAYDYNAQIDLDNTANALITNEQRYSSLVGKQAVAYAAAGVDITRGSPLLMMAATAGRGGREAAEIYESGTEASTLEKYYGKLAAFRGTIGGIGSFLSGISSSATNYLKDTGYQGGGDSASDTGTVAAFNQGDWGVSGN